MAPGGDSHSTKGEYDSKGLSKASLACYRGRRTQDVCSWRDSQSLAFSPKQGHRILRIFKAEIHGNQEALLFQSQCDAAL